MEKGRGRRPSICIICNTLANRETAQLSWKTPARVDATALRYHTAAWAWSCGHTDAALFTSLGRFLHSPHEFRARRVAVRELDTGSLQRDAQRLDCPSVSR